MSLFSGKKRAQAAVELLTTYGWAIMGVVVVIGALSYFDVFDAKRFISERCDTGSQIQCLESYARSDGEFRLALRNNYLVGVVIEEIYVDGQPMSYFDDYYTGSMQIPLNSGNISQFGSADIGTMIKGDKKTMDVVVVFRRDVPNVDDCFEGICYNASGTITVKVQDASHINIVPIDE